MVISGPATDFGAALLDVEAPTPEGVIGPDGQLAPKRFSVYRNNVIVSLTEALEQSFPATRHLLGDEYFKALARAFVTAHPPTSPVLLWYGADLSDFIAAFPPLASYPYVADVAHLEWAWLQSYHAEDAKVLDPQALNLVDAARVGDLQFKIHPATTLLNSHWPILSLALANRFAMGSPLEINLDESQSVLVTRPEFDVQLQQARPGMDIFFSELRRGATLQNAATRACERNNVFALSECLSDLLTAGAFSDVILDGESLPFSEHPECNKGVA